MNFCKESFPLKVFLPIYIAIAVFSAHAVLAGSDAHVDPVSELQDAALNYEAAARAHMNIANNFLRSRQEEPSEEEPNQRRNRRTSNAGLELQAAEQLMNAAANFDHASRVWNAAVQANPDKESRAFFRQSSREARQRATSLIRRAAALAEHAALEYAAVNDLQNQGRASHRAGRIREQLAGRN